MKTCLNKLILSTGLFFAATGAYAQEAATDVPKGTHFGVSDVVILITTLSMAVLLTILILAINSAIRNLSESLPSIIKERSKKAGMLLVLIAGSSMEVFGQTTEKVDAPFILGEGTFWALITLVLVLMLFALYQLSILRQLIKTVRGEEEVIPPLKEGQPAWVDWVLDKLQASVPIDEERDVLMDHEYDGIRELDNVLPPWWKWGFYLSIAFGALYLLHYHVLGSGDLQIAEYEKDVAAAERAVEEYRMRKALNVTEKSVTFDMAYVQSGKILYDQNCKSCHGSGGEGGVGPNFADDYWIHGGSIQEIFSTVKYGVPEKGMISWQTQLSPVQMRDVSSFIYTLRDTDPPNQKAPQGELYVEDEAPAAEAEAEVMPADSTEIVE